MTCRRSQDPREIFKKNFQTLRLETSKFFTFLSFCSTRGNFNLFSVEISPNNSMCCPRCCTCFFIMCCMRMEIYSINFCNLFPVLLSSFLLLSCLPFLLMLTFVRPTISAAVKNKIIKKTHQRHDQQQPADYIDEWRNNVNSDSGRYFHLFCLSFFASICIYFA